MNSGEFSVGCPNCEKWFQPITPIPVDSAACDSLVVSTVSYRCPQCEILVPCNKENCCIRFSDGRFWGAWEERHEFFSGPTAQDRLRQRVKELKNEDWIYLGSSGFAHKGECSANLIRRSTRFKG
jgi:hypothetical protein